jgi:uncharacterized protein (DUF58 family)
VDGSITAANRNKAGAPAWSVAKVNDGTVANPPNPAEPLASKKVPRQLALDSAGTRIGPGVSLGLVTGLLAVGACIVPWLRHGWLWFNLIASATVLVLCFDVLTLWVARKEFQPVLLCPEKGLRGREGQTIGLPLALVASGQRRSNEILVGIMPATQEAEVAVRVSKEPQLLKLDESRSISADPHKMQLWPWMPEMTLLRRGLWRCPRVGVERWSRLRVWRLRRWFDIPEQLRIEADLRPGRREVLRSPVYRALVAAQQTPWAGHGRDFERLREYQPGDNYSEIAWKSTARRGAPVTRLFQWEQKQEVYFVVDQSRASALALDSRESSGPQQRAPRRLLDLSVETALVGATVALELGDQFGLVTYAEEPKSWLRAGSGRTQFHRIRERLLNIEPLPTTADYEALFAEIRVRLRRRAYLLVLGDLAERSVSDSFHLGVGLVRSSHAVLMTSILPAYAQPAFSPADDLKSEEDVYAALAGEKENQRLGAFARQMRQLDVQLRYMPAEMFLRTAVGGYMESKREQRL